MLAELASLGRLEMRTSEAPQGQLSTQARSPCQEGTQTPCQEGTQTPGPRCQPVLALTSRWFKSYHFPCEPTGRRAPCALMGMLFNQDSAGTLRGPVEARNSQRAKRLLV